MSQGIVTRRSRYSVDESVARLENLLRDKGIKLFAVVDHTAEAAAAGLEMPPTRVLLFGNPKAGTPVMLAAPSAALDLPLKILIAQDPQGRVWLSWNDPVFLQQRHNFPEELIRNLAAADALTRELAE